MNSYSFEPDEPVIGSLTVSCVSESTDTTYASPLIPPPSTAMYTSTSEVSSQTKMLESVSTSQVKVMVRVNSVGSRVGAAVGSAVGVVEGSGVGAAAL